ncbi:hypothetical protein [Dietzia alimentaria]|uniref:hypothetical protein n=1 Tax=Dietzia alimentaria TaxID=665550 RepID=UPI00029ABB02|nr:hypothetical protein [Dietzia alimentaria]
MGRPASCRLCGHEIAFTTLLPSGKTVPLDVSPDPELGIYHRRFFIDQIGRRTSSVVQLSGHDLDEARDRARRYPADRPSRLWVPHFATCPARRPHQTETTR